MFLRAVLDSLQKSGSTAIYAVQNATEYEKHFNIASFTNAILIQGCCVAEVL